MTEQTVKVRIGSAWLSKINWGQFVGGLSMLIVFFGGTALTPEQQAAIITCIGLAQGAFTYVCRTWFTRSITPSSM